MGDARWRHRLNPVLDDAVVYLSNLMGGNILDMLLAKGLLTTDQYEDLNRLRKRCSDYEVARELFSILRKRPAPSYDSFCDLLRQIEGGNDLHHILVTGKETKRNSCLFPISHPVVAATVGVMTAALLLTSVQQYRMREDTRMTPRDTGDGGTVNINEGELPELPSPKPPDVVVSHSQEKKPKSKDENMQYTEGKGKQQPKEVHPPDSCEALVQRALDAHPEALSSPNPHEIKGQITLLGRSLFIVVKPYMPTDNPSKYEADILDLMSRKNNVGAESSLSKEDAAIRGLLKFCQKNKSRLL